MDFDLSEYNRIKIINEDFSSKNLSEMIFYECKFENCNFTQTILTGSDFENCYFCDCDLTNPQIRQTKFNKVKFKTSRLMGLNFYQCGQFAFNANFDSCIISNCNFNEMKMMNTNFNKCEIIDSYFQETYLVGASFEGSQFRNTLFHKTNLEKASFCHANGYHIDPTVNNVRKAKFTVPDVLNLLNGFEIDIADNF